MSRIISSPPSTDAGACFFRGFDRTQKRPLSPSLFLSVTLICISPHIGKPHRASKGGLRPLDVLEYNAISRWYPWKSSVIFPFGAGTARCQVSRLFVFPLNPYGRLWLHVHDTWTYRGVFNHWSNGETFIFTADRPRPLQWTGRGDENRFFAVLLWIIFAPFFLWELYIEIDSVEEVGWGKRLSRNPGNEERWSSSSWPRIQTSGSNFHNKSRYVSSCQMYVL